MTSELQGETLLAVARNAIATRLGEPGISHADQPWLHDPAATFVTLTQQGALRGCIGSLEPHRTLLEDVSANAVAAATRDHRFSPLQAGELGRTRIEVSLLSASSAIEFESEAHVLNQLRPGVDGLILQYGQQRGTFLPQVWDQLPQAKNFLTALKHKAGLPADFWAADLQLSRYTVQKWKEAVPEHD